MGSMNRGGLPGAAFELDDRFTGHRAEDIGRCGFDAGKLLLRIDYDDPGSLTTLETTPAPSTTWPRADSPASSSRSSAAARRRQARATTSPRRPSPGRSPSPRAWAAPRAYTWLKVPVTDDPDDMAEVMETSTLPAVLLGGEVGDDQDGAYAKWRGRAATAHRAGPGRRAFAAVPGGRGRRRRRRHRRRLLVEGTHEQRPAPRAEGHHAPQRRLRARHRRRSGPAGTYCSLRVARAGAGRRAHLRHRRQRMVVLPLEGGCTVRADGRVSELAGPGSRVRGGHPTSRTFPGTPTSRSPPARGPLRPGRSEVRATTPRPLRPARRRSPSSCAAPATAPARCSNFAAADAFDCDRLIAVEVHHPRRQLVLVPAAQARRAPARARRPNSRRSTTSRSHGRGTASATSASTPSRERRDDVLAEVRTGDAVLVPDGWHGPSMAAPGLRPCTT